MAALAEAFVRLRPDTSTFRQEAVAGIDKSGDGIKKAADKHGKVFGSAFVKSTAGPIRGIAGVVGPSVAAAFAVIGGAKLFAGFISEGREAQKVGAQTAAVIKSTGGAAKVSADQVGALATSISNKVGVDDEAIQSGANLLLTFTGIRNEAGKGNKIFDQATTVVTDMAAAMNNGDVTTQGLKAASIQVGKALNDPVKGMTALSKVGVTFTKGQKDQIAALVKNHDTLGAQKIILGELNKEFGGSAAAGTNAMEKLKVVFGNIEEQVGTALLPIIDRLASWLAERLPGAIKSVTHWFGVAKSGISALIGAFKEGDVTSGGFVGVMERIGVVARQVAGFVNNIVPSLVRFGGFVRDTVIPALGQFAQWLGPILGKAFAAIGHWIMDTAVPALRSFGGFITGTIVPAAKTLWAFLSTNLGPTFASLGQLLVTRIFPALQGLWARLQQIWPTVSKVIVFVAKLIGVLLAVAVVVLGKVLPILIRLAGPVFTLLFAAIGKVIGIIAALLRVAVAAFVGIGNAGKFMWQNVLQPAFNALKSAFTAVSTAFGALRDLFGRVWAKIKDIFTAAIRGVVNTFLGMVGSILTGAAKAFGWIPGIGPKLKAAAAEFRKFRDDVNAAMNGIKSKSFTVTAKASVLMGQGLSRQDAIATSLHRATGGPVFGAGSATSDSIPAMLSNGEHVLTAREVKAFGGHDAVLQMRRSVVSGFAAGGPVDVRVVARTLGLDQFRSDVAAVNRFATDLVTGAAKRANATGGFSPGLAGVVNFAKAMAGRPYGWGSAGPNSFDCSGFVSNLVEVAKGLPLYRRLFATGSMGSYPWTNHFGGAFRVGWTTNAGGGIGHTAATVNGVNMESRGGDGVVVGSRSRGANQGIFNRHAFLARGGPVLPGDPPFDVLDPRGKHFRPGLLDALKSVRSFDSGGHLSPGWNAPIWNGTRRPETVTPGQTMDAVITELRALRKSVERTPLVRPDERFIRRTVQYGATRDPGQWGP